MIAGFSHIYSGNPEPSLSMARGRDAPSCLTELGMREEERGVPRL
jgi:hypothetical protein